MTSPRLPNARTAVAMWADFRSFLLKQNVVALAIAVVVGAALNEVVKSIVEHLLMPIVAVATPPGETWRTWTLTVGPFEFGVGAIAAALLNFLIVGLVAWRIAKLIITPDAPPTPKLPTQGCPYCVSEIDARATRCPHCTSQLVVRADSVPSLSAADAPLVARRE